MNLPEFEAWAEPLAELLHDQFVTPAWLARRWQISTSHLTNLRRAQRGLPWTKFATGAVRYRLSHVIRAELEGANGPPSLDVVLLAIASAPGLDGRSKAAAQSAVMRAFRKHARQR